MYKVTDGYVITDNTGRKTSEQECDLPDDIAEKLLKSGAIYNPEGAIKPKAKKKAIVKAKQEQADYEA